MRRPLLVLTAVTFVTWTGTRVNAIALPLVALTETGQAWATGLVGGAAGLPLLTVSWWGRGLRDRLLDGRALAVLMVVQAAGLAVVPVAAASGRLGALALCASGLVTGAAGALLGPAQRGLVADLADLADRADRAGAGTADGAGRRGGGGRASAPRWLAWQDLAHRVSMVFAPPAGAWLLLTWGAEPLLWCESAVVLLGALALLTVPASGAPEPASTEPASTEPASPGPASPGPAAGSTAAVLREHPELAAGMLMAAVGGLCWFAFTLGLSVLGVETGRPGALVAAGLSGYGAASVAASLLTPLLVDRLPRLGTMAASWALLGLAFAALPLAAPDLLPIALVAAVGGAAMPWSIAALNALISEQTRGAQRRAVFTAETVLHSGGVSVGLLVGGSIIGWAGATPVLLAAGAAQLLTAAAGLLLGRRRSAHHEPCTRPSA
ncbi:MFS transporter, partial [Kineococcus sp. T13]|uniref:MFS transporter n=1 Tax=Kineococcus vitellinus TaxID=2696565 RepID=UPI00141257E7